MYDIFPDIMFHPKNKTKKIGYHTCKGRCSAHDPMVSALDSGSGSPGLSPGWALHCIFCVASIVKKR